MLEQGKDLLLDGEFARVGQFVTVPGENFDSVIRPGIVRGGDHDAGIEPARAGQISNAGRGDDSGTLDFDAVGRKPEGNAIGDPVAGLASVLADHNACARIVALEIVAQGAADSIGRVSGERELTSHTADSVRAKKLTLITHSGVFSSLQQGPRLSP